MGSSQLFTSQIACDGRRLGCHRGLRKAALSAESADLRLWNWLICFVVSHMDLWGSVIHIYIYIHIIKRHVIENHSFKLL